MTDDRDLLDLAPGSSTGLRAANRLRPSPPTPSAPRSRSSTARSRRSPRPRPAGVGVRVIVEGRLGFASTSDVSEDGLTYALEEAGPTRRTGRPTSATCCRCPATRGACSADCRTWSPRASTTCPVARKVAMAVELERLTGPPTRGSPAWRRRSTATRSPGARSSRPPGINAAYSRTDAYAYVSALARAGDETQTGLGLSMGRGVADLDLEAAGREGALRATRLLGATKPATASVPVVSTRSSPRPSSGSWPARSPPTRCKRAARCSPQDWRAGRGHRSVDHRRRASARGPWFRPVRRRRRAHRPYRPGQPRRAAWAGCTTPRPLPGPVTRRAPPATPSRAGHASTPGVASSNLDLVRRRDDGRGDPPQGRHRPLRAGRLRRALRGQPGLRRVQRRRDRLLDP